MPTFRHVVEGYRPRTFDLGGGLAQSSHNRHRHVTRGFRVGDAASARRTPPARRRPPGGERWRETGLSRPVSRHAPAWAAVGGERWRETGLSRPVSRHAPAWAAVGGERWRETGLSRPVS